MTKWTLLILALLLIGCQSTPNFDAKYHQQTNVIQLSNPGVDLSRFQTFAVINNPKNIVIGDEFNSYQVNKLLEQELKRQMVQKGYRSMGDSQNSDFYIVYTLALEEFISDKQLVEQFGLNPGLSKSSKNLNQYKKGTLIVDLIESKSRQSAYRSALQGFAHLQISQNQRQNRISSIVTKLIDAVPKKRQQQ